MLVMIFYSYTNMDHAYRMTMAHDGKIRKVMKMMSEDEWEMKKLQDLQNKQRLDRPVQSVLRLFNQMVPEKALGMRISERFEFMKAKLNAPGLRSEIIWKVARALEEKRIEEYRIAGVYARLENASNRGAYFVACAKGAFAAVDLSWFEEEWQDA